MNLYEPHLSAVSTALENFGIDPSILFQWAVEGDVKKQSEAGQLQVQRTLMLSNSGRLKSVCRINGRHLSLKSLRNIVAPLFTRVDVGAASAALGRPASRLAMIDMGVSERLKQTCVQSREKYKEARKSTEKIKHDLESRILPSSLQRKGRNSDFEDDQVELLGHWVEELGESRGGLAHYYSFWMHSLGPVSPFAITTIPFKTPLNQG